MQTNFTITEKTQTQTHSYTREDREGERARGGEGRREGRRAQSTKKIGAQTGTMYHTIKHPSVKHTLRCVYIMHLVCCAGESVCATSHLQNVFRCRVAVGCAKPAVRHQKKRNAFACQALKKMCGGPRKNDHGFSELRVKTLK